ncbi:MAG: S-adenosylmethionine:tRNA ribosyltransferase-isomerase [Cytophagales bacterium]|nr:S-adenosylmethionine:tRNA ribosyltransferase-isomerase [Cytophagales bacterium]
MSIDLKDYHYSLPDERIAKFPLPKRSNSKLLLYKNGEISHTIFKSISDHLPEKCILVFNDTKVIPARLIFYKSTGARIEVFLLEPSRPSNYEQNMNAKISCSWHCMIGNSKKWKTEEIEVAEIGLKATRQNDEVTFTWEQDLTFSEILEFAGKIPLPPYIDREVIDSDKDRYQTVYSKHEGAVAAPTAGLHFTDKLLTELDEKGIAKDYLTLHVSAGTFQPIKAETVDDHPMHREQIIITKKNVENLLKSESIIPVGTTSLRTLESLYWYGVKLLNGDTDFFIPKLYPYGHSNIPDKTDSLRAVLDYMGENKTSKLVGHTEIFIFPGYTFRICSGLITNFHLPGSTLILLVAAMIGEDWKKVYQEALAQNYRFLSFGDSSLLLS